MRLAMRRSADVAALGAFARSAPDVAVKALTAGCTAGTEERREPRGGDDGARRSTERVDGELPIEPLAARLALRGAPLPVEALEAALLEPLRRFLARPGKRLRARLVEIGWSLGGGGGMAPHPLPLAVETLHAGSLIVDDVEDASTHRRGAPALHHEIGVPLAVNAGGFLYFWPFELLRSLELPLERELDCARRLHAAILRCHAGQALDLGIMADAVPRAELRPLAAAASEWKTGALMSLSLSLGAAAAGAPGDALDALEACGAALGVGFQMLDDIENVVGARAAEKRGEDLRHGRVSWAWVWASEASNGDPDGFEALRVRGRRVRLGVEPPEPLAEMLAATGARRGVAEANATLHCAVEELDRTVGGVAASGLPDLVRALRAGRARESFARCPGE
jgi:geranylgeranyl pyrophosphate synthase